MIREVKSNPYKILKIFIEDNRCNIGLKNGEINIIKITELPIVDRYSTGSQIVKGSISDSFVVATLIKPGKEQDTLIDDSTVEEIEVLEEEPILKKNKVNLKEIDDRLMTIDDFLE